MRGVFGKVFPLAWVVVFILLLSLSGGIFSIYIVSRVDSYAEMVNNLGIIRGSIQRFVKLELAGMETDEQIKQIDAAIEGFQNKKLSIDENNRISEGVNELSQKWLDLKEFVQKFRSDTSVINKNTLLEKSEEVWAKSNEMVLISQIVADEKISWQNSIYILSIVNILLGMLIVIMLQNYIRKSLEQLAYYDGLTSLYNRRYFNETLDKEITKATRYKNSFCLILFDFDHFKKINDTFGHDMGDSVLKQLSENVKKNIRKSDVLARIGGDELAIIAIETNLDGAFELSEKVRKAVASQNFLSANKMTISLGVAAFIKGDSFDTLFNRADRALYKAKKMGRNRSERG